MNGLDISLDQFKRMKSQDRDELIYKNLVHIRKTIGDTKFHRKLHYVWLSSLTIFVGLGRYLGLI